MRNRSIYILLQALCIYYSFYGLILFLGPLGSLTLQNPTTPHFAKIIDEALCLLLCPFLVAHPKRYKLINYLILLMVVLGIMSVIFFRITENHGANVSYVKSLIISIIILLAFTTIELSKISNLIRLYIFLNAFATVLSVGFFIKNPYVAYGGRLLGNYANPNTSAFVYTILLAMLMLVGKYIYGSYRRKNLLIGMFILIYSIGLITTFSKVYIAISTINILIMLNLGIFVVTAILIVMLLNIIISIDDLFILNTVSQRLSDYNLWTTEMAELYNLIFGRECEDCSSFYSDASFINIISSYGLLVGLVLVISPLLLMVYSSINLRNFNVNIQKKYLASFSFCYLSILFHYQVEIQPTQILIYLSALLPSILLAKSKEVNMCQPN